MMKSHSNFAASMAAAGIIFCIPLIPSRAATTQGPPIGININFAGDWVPDLLFADAFRENRGWNTASGSPAPVDANGWPTTDANTYVWAGQTLDMSGTYALSFSGQATVACTGGTACNCILLGICNCQ